MRVLVRLEVMLLLERFAAIGMRAAEPLLLGVDTFVTRQIGVPVKRRMTRFVASGIDPVAAVHVFLRVLCLGCLAAVSALVSDAALLTVSCDRCGVSDVITSSGGIL